MERLRVNQPNVAACRGTCYYCCSGSRNSSCVLPPDSTKALPITSGRRPRRLATVLYPDRGWWISRVPWRDLTYHPEAGTTYVCSDVRL